MSTLPVADTCAGDADGGIEGASALAISSNSFTATGAIVRWIAAGAAESAGALDGEGADAIAEVTVAEGVDATARAGGASTDGTSTEVGA
jgi:hypothetical protein